MKISKRYIDKTFRPLSKLFITYLFVCLALNNLTAQSVSDSSTLLYKTLHKVSYKFDNKANKTVAELAPVVAWNNYDKTQIGFALISARNAAYDFAFIPMFGTGSLNVTGLADGNYRKSWNSQNELALGIAVKRFSYLLFPEDLTYNKLQPSLAHTFSWKDGAVGLQTGFVHRSIWQEFLLTKNSGRETSYFFDNECYVSLEKVDSMYQVKAKLRSNFGANYWSLQFSSNLRLPYGKPKNGLHARFFAGYFFTNPPNNYIHAPLPVFQLSGSGNTGFHWLQKDYNFNDLYLDRNGQDAFLRKQIANSEGGFYSFTSAGNSTTSLLAINLESDVMLAEKVQRIINFRPFVNMAVSGIPISTEKIYAETGVSMLLLNGLFTFHLPVVTTNNIQLNQESIFGIKKGEWYKRITFGIHLSNLKDYRKN